MNELKLLITTLRNIFKFNHHDWKAIESRLNPLEIELLHIVGTDENINDHISAEKLFKTIPNDSNFARYRQNLFDKLIVEAIHFNPSNRSYSTFERNRYKCEKLYLVLKIFNKSRQHILAKNIASRLIGLSRKYHFTEIRIGTNEYLHSYYSLRELNQTKAQHYLEDLEKSQNIRHSEFSAHSKYYIFGSKLLHGTSNEIELMQLGKKFKTILDKEKNKNPESHKFYLAYYSLMALISESQDKPEQTLRVARQGLEFFKNLPYEHKSAKIVFMLFMTNSYLVLGLLTEAKQVINETLRIQKSGSNNWFMAKWLLIQIELCQSNYDRANDEYKVMVSHKNYKEQSAQTKDIMEICGAYIGFIAIKYGITNCDFPNRFRIKNRLKAMAQIHANNQRIIIPTLIAQIMFHALDSNFMAVGKCVQKLEVFGKSKLSLANPNYRINCFIKMIGCIPNGHFHSYSVKIRSDKYLNRMKSIDFRFTDAKKVVEIIPYETLWKMILDCLKTPKSLLIMPIHQ